MKGLRSCCILSFCWVLWGCLTSQTAGALDSPLRMASFNIQIFGQSKINDAKVVGTLVRILDRYDLIFIQEIRDSQNSAMHQLLDRLNAFSSKSFRLLLSDRLGRTMSKEQYAYVYNEGRLAALDSYIYPDPQDAFEREPFMARFQADDLDFTLIGIHVTPRDVEGELRSLNNVYRQVKTRYQDGDVLLMGDLNADCTYYKAALGFQYFDERAYELIPPGTDTTVAAPVCTYDRALAFGDINGLAFQGRAFDFQSAYQLSGKQAMAVSDHFPIEFTLRTSSEIKMEGELDDDSVDVKQPDSPASCGLRPYRTPRAYCYASFPSGLKRVAAACCLEFAD